MRAVIDTNVVVAALLNRAGAPARVVAAAVSGRLRSLHDARILAERRRVLALAKLSRIPASDVATLLDRLERTGERIMVISPYTGAAPDPDDVCFIEVALAGRADCIITGNAKDFPPDCGVAVMSPAEVAATLDVATPP